MRLTAEVHVIGSGRLGLGITHDLDCHVYLIDGGGEAALIDAGVGLSGQLIVDEIIRSGVDPSRVRTLLLTHAHPDHAGGTADLVRRLGVRVFASPATAAAVRAADRAATGLEVGVRAGLYPADFGLEECLVGEVHHGDRLAVGSVVIEVVATPGHSAGHLSFMLHRPGGSDLFSGDAMLFGGQIILQPTDDCEWYAQLDTLHRLAELTHEGLFPGHLGVAVRGGDRHARAAVERIAATGTPPLFAP
ncbi:MAG: MBL fold metallo-hydrolase [Actinobacteria bacterium]|nr:MBL fold metallo-hydrolase [Actinomycetota bacterium]